MKPSLPLALLLGLGSAFLASGCGAPPEPENPNRHPVAVRAPFDLNCPREQVVYQRLDARTMGVSGCGRRATYIRVCRDRIRNSLGNSVDTYVECSWLLDGAS
jgi:hypothetical protein